MIHPFPNRLLPTSALILSALLGPTLHATELVPLNEFATPADFTSNFTVTTGFTGLSVAHSAEDDGGIGRGGFMYVPPETGSSSNLIYIGSGGPTFGDVTIAMDHDPMHSAGFIVRANPARTDSIRVLFTNRRRVRIWKEGAVDSADTGALLYDQTGGIAQEGWSHLRLDVRNVGAANDQVELTFRAYNSQVRFDETTLAATHTYTLSVADSAPYLAPGEIGLRLLETQTRIDNFAVYAYGTAPAALNFPELVGFHPLPGANFHPAEEGLSFRARSPAGIDPAGVSLLLNGVDVSASLQVSGDPGDRLVHYPQLTPNTDYVAEITVTALSGEITTRRLEFRSESPTEAVPLIDLIEFADETDFTSNFTVANGPIAHIPEWDRGIGRGGFLRSSTNTNVVYDTDGVPDTQVFQDFTATFDRRSGASAAFILRGNRATDSSIRVMLSNRNRIRIWTNANITGSYGGDLVFDESIPVGVPAGIWYHNRVDVRNVGEEWDRQIEIRFRAYGSQNELAVPGSDYTFTIPSWESVNHLEAGEVGFRLVGVGELDNFGIYEYGKAPVWGSHPTITAINPAPGIGAINWSDPFSFEVAGPVATPQSGIRVWFDGAEVSGNLVFNGDEHQWFVSYHSGLPGGPVFIEAQNAGATTTAYFDYPEALIPLPVRDGQVLWTEADAVAGADRDGSNYGHHVPGLSRAIGIAVDHASRKIYFADNATGRIGRMNFDLSGAEDVLTGRTNPQFVALTPDRIFWTEYSQGLWSADRNGGDVQHLIPLVDQATAGLAIDPHAGKVYIASALDGGSLYRSNLDGSNLDVLWQFTLAPGTYGLAIDSEQGLLYTANYDPSGTIIRHNLATGAATPLYSNRPYPLGIALSEDGGTLFWAERNDPAQAATSGRVLTAPAEGLGTITEVATGLNSPFGIALVPPATGGTFAEWIAQFDLPSGQDGPQDDPAGDGIANLLNYALGGNPLAANRGLLPTATLENADGEQYLTLTVARDPAATGVTLIVDVSGDPGAWFSGPEHTTLLVDTPELLVVRDNLPISAANRRFIRLRALEQ